MDCSDTRVGEWKLAIPILHPSRHVVHARAHLYQAPPQREKSVIQHTSA